MDRLPIPRTLLLLLLLVCASTLHAQIPTGKEFLVPLPSVMTWAERNDTTIRFIVEVMCSRESKVSIRWANRPASDPLAYIVFNTTVQAGARAFITSPMQFQLFQIAQSDTRDSSLLPNARGLLVTSDQPVTVQATFSKNYRTETYMVPPTSSFDTTYTVLTHNGYANNSGRTGFIVTAREDNTVLRINPKADVMWGRTAGTVYTITLQKYQVYQALSANGGNGLINDMTGTTIYSNKPVGLITFGYPSIPQSVDPPPPPTPPNPPTSEMTWTAKTILEPQLPDSMSGRLFYTVPFARGLKSYVRVMTVDKNVSVDVNGTFYRMDKVPGTFYDIRIGGPTKIEATGRVSAMQFAVSSDSSGFDTTVVRSGSLPDTLVHIPYGDPMMAWLPPVSQYKSALQWASPALSERPYKFGTSPLVFYWTHYALVTAPATAASSVTIDGVPVVFTMTHSDGRYVSAIVRVLPRQHVVEAEEPVSVLAYGFTWNDSYGMASGEALRSVGRTALDSIGYISCSNELDTTFVIRNLGNNSFRIDSVTATGIPIRIISPAFFPFEVPAHDSAYIAVVFRMAQPGAYQGTLRIHTDANNRQLFTIPVRGTRDSAQLQYLSTVDFARLKSTETTRDTVIRIRNNGTRPVTITDIIFDRPGYRIMSPTFPRTLAAGATELVTVRFAPTADGSYESRMTILGTPCFNQTSINLIGYKGSGATILLRRSIDYPRYDCSMTAPPFVDSLLIIRNNGDEPAQILTAAITGANAIEFSLVETLVGRTILPGASDTVHVRYTPGGYGARSAYLDITTTASNAASVQIILRAWRDRAAVTASLRTIDFKQILSCGEAIDTVVVLQNPGTVWDTLTVTSSDVTTFGVDQSRQIIIFPGGSYELPVRFSPTANGQFNAKLTITGTPCVLGEEITVTGSRVAPSLAVTPSVLRFDTLYTCEGGKTAQITLRNDGAVTDTIFSRSIAGSSEFTITGADTIILAPGEQRTVDVVFSPTSRGSYLGAARFDWGPCAANTSVDLQAEVVEPIVTLSAPSLDIGTVDILTTKRGSVTLKNESPVVRQVTGITLAPTGLFTLIAPASFPAFIPPGGEITIEFEYAASEPGRSDAIATVALAGPCPEEKTIAVSATAVGQPTVPVSIGMGVPTLTGDIDQVIAIPISITRSTNLPLAEGRTLSFWLSYRTTMLLPQGVTTGIPGMTARIVRDSFASGRRSTLIELTGGILPSEGEVARVDALVLLGDATTTTLELSTPELVFGNAIARVATVFPPANGTFTSTGYCVTGGERLIRRGGLIKLTGSRPNPFRGETEIGLELAERRHVELRLIDARGVVVARIIDGELDAGIYTIPFSAGTLSSGMYVCELRSQGTIQRAMMIVLQ